MRLNSRGGKYLVNSVWRYNLPQIIEIKKHSDFTEHDTFHVTPPPLTSLSIQFWQNRNRTAIMTGDRKHIFISFILYAHFIQFKWGNMTSNKISVYTSVYHKKRAKKITTCTRTHTHTPGAWKRTVDLTLGRTWSMKLWMLKRIFSRFEGFSLTTFW